MSLLGELSTSEKQDFLAFEGNAQSFRICARLWDRARIGGGQLTLPVYGALIKYPVNSNESKNYDSALKKAKEENDSSFEIDLKKKKFNYFEQDSMLVQEVFTGLSISKLAAGGYPRHPLAYLMEAADDICYQIIDIEDAVEQKIISESKFFDLMKSIILKGKIEELNIRSVSEMRARAIGAMIDVVSEVIRKNIDDILSGRLNVSLTDAVRKENETVANAFEALKALAAKEIYTERRVLQVEYAGFKIIGGLLDAFAGPLINFTEKKHMSASEKKITDCP